VRLGVLLAASCLLASCGGESGSGLTLSSSSVAFRALAPDMVADSREIQISWGDNFAVAGVIVGVPPGQSLPGWLDVSLDGSSSPLTLTVRRASGILSVGHFEATLRVVTVNVRGGLLDMVDLPVTFDSIAVPTVSPGTLNLAWTESGQPNPAPPGLFGSFSGKTQPKSARLKVAVAPSPEAAALVLAWFRMPQPPLMLSGMNGTGTLWVMSMTESIRPAVPQYTLMSAARTAPPRTASTARYPAPTWVYDCGF